MMISHCRYVVRIQQMFLVIFFVRWIDLTNQSEYIRRIPDQYLLYSSGQIRGLIVWWNVPRINHRPASSHVRAIGLSEWKSFSWLLVKKILEYLENNLFVELHFDILLACVLRYSDLNPVLALGARYLMANKYKVLVRSSLVVGGWSRRLLDASSPHVERARDASLIKSARTSTSSRWYHIAHYGGDICRRYFIYPRRQELTIKFTKELGQGLLDPIIPANAAHTPHHIEL